MKKIVCGVLMGSIVIAGQTFAGDFSSSCKNIHLSGSTLKASCQKAVGGVWAGESSINLNDHIGNRNGALIWDKKNFDDHCENKSLAGPDKPSYPPKLFLKARCRNDNKVYVSAEINLNERISNIDGKLKYDQ